MKKTLRTIAVMALLSVSTASYAQQGADQPFGTTNSNGGLTDNTPRPATAPSQLNTLKSQYQSDILAAVKPIRNRYVSALQTLLKTLTQNGDLDGALAVQQELKNPGSQPAAVQQPGSGLPSLLDNLKSQYKSDVQPIVKPIQDRYIAALKILMRTLTQNGDLDGALAVQQELKGFGAQQAATESKAAGFAGTVWETKHNPGSKSFSLITFRADGSWQENWESKIHRGHWKPTSDSNVVEIQISGGDDINGDKIVHYEMSADGESCTRHEDSVTWFRKITPLKDQASF